MTRTREIRRAAQTDAAAIRDVARESWHAAYDDLLGSDTVDAVVDDWYAIDRLRSAIGASSHHVFVAGEVVGFGHASPWEGAPDVAHLTRLYVHPAFWGDGVGSHLLEHLDAALAGEGYERLRLEVFAENDVGVGFYESRGFDRLETIEEEFLGETYDVAVYGRPIGSE
ncbi:GNAT family N-acetyltransferase [Natrononativus amylolyticus]|uniref:GNAT family N-acetyltransferase n=1 Tax=Natrononativus amylolyticus TaxID=2963434 RepID=UPI0020CB6DCF|nr:GNAT family N-acetyltransferase [Natrononativus amylolyticus]